jgi:hypothetical protein
MGRGGGAATIVKSLIAIVIGGRQFGPVDRDRVRGRNRYRGDARSFVNLLQSLHVAFTNGR